MDAKFWHNNCIHVVNQYQYPQSQHQPQRDLSLTTGILLRLTAADEWILQDNKYSTSLSYNKYNLYKNTSKYTDTNWRHYQRRIK